MLNQSHSLNGLRLLVVDDDPDTICLLAFLFEADGAELMTASSAIEALEALKYSSPDILISDIMLPGEDGYSLISKIRNLEAEQGGKIPAIALSGCAREEDSIQALSAGFQAHLSKPVDLDELVEVVASMAEKTRKLEREVCVEISLAV